MKICLIFAVLLIFIFPSANGAENFVLAPFAFFTSKYYLCKV